MTWLSAFRDNHDLEIWCKRWLRSLDFPSPQMRAAAELVLFAMQQKLHSR
jgi:hypothetical protein